MSNQLKSEHNNNFIENVKCDGDLSRLKDSDYVDTSRSNSVGSTESTDLSNQSLVNSGIDVHKTGIHDNGTSVNSPRSTPVDPEYQFSHYIYSTKNTPNEVLDSGISSPIFLAPDNLDYIKNKIKVSSKEEIEYDPLELLSGDQSKSLSTKCQLRLPKLSTCHQGSSNIGGIVSRIRSLSIGVSPNSNSSSRRASGEVYSLPSDCVSPVCTSPDQDLDPMKLPKEYTNSSINFTNKNIRSQKKWMRMTHSLSCDVDSFNINELPSRTTKGKDRSRDETVYMPSASPAMNRLERFLSGHIDTSTPNGALLTVINQGLRKVSESDRYLLFSKSPLRSPVDFLESGIEHLGDSDILITVLHHSTCYDLMPESSKLIVLDSTLSINKAFIAMEDNNVDNAPIWSCQDQSFIGVLNKDDQMYMLLLAYQYIEKSSDVDEYMERISRESLSNCLGRAPARHQLQWVNPESTICSVIKRLEMASLSQILVLDGQRSGNALYILDHRRILTFLLSASQYGLPLPRVLKTTVGVTELMMNKKILEQYKVHLDTNLSTLLDVMDSNRHRCALVCKNKPPCKTCLCTDECIGLLTVYDISLLISKSNHCDPFYKVESILMDTTCNQKNIVYCEEGEPVISIIKTIIQKKAPFILINQACCGNCIHSIISSKELLNYIMKHDKSSAVRENLYTPVKRRSTRSYSCCEDMQRISDINLSGVSLDEKDEDVFNMEVS